MTSSVNLTGGFNPDFCQYRLPCGYCEKLGRDCPKSYIYKLYDTGPITINGVDAAITTTLEKKECL